MVLTVSQTALNSHESQSHDSSFGALFANGHVSGLRANRFAIGSESARDQGDTMIRIPLQNGKFALIDDSDLALVEEHHPWRAVKTKTLSDGREQFYVRSHTGGYLHRLLMNPLPSERVDHENHDGLDNQRANLRKCNHSQNGLNRNRVKPVRTSKYIGVCLNNGAWLAQIQLGGGTRISRKCVFIGRFPDELSAAYARDQYVRTHKIEYATLNFPEKTDYSDIKRRQTSSGNLFGVSFKQDRLNCWRVRLTDPKTGKEVSGGAYFDKDVAGRAADSLMRKLGIVGKLNFPSEQDEC